MPRKGHTEEQIVFALKQAENGAKVAEICRKLGITEQTFYRWKKEYQNLGVSELRGLRQLREENTRLKKLVADLIRSKLRKKIARRRPVIVDLATGPNQRWSMAFVADRLEDGRKFRILTVVDQFSRECVALYAKPRLQGSDVAETLDHAIGQRGQPSRKDTNNRARYTSSKTHNRRPSGCAREIQMQMREQVFCPF